MRRSRRRNRATSDRRIRDCSNDFPENRRIAAQHAWMWSLFPGAARRRQQRAAALQSRAEEAAPVSPDAAVSKEIERQEEVPHHKPSAASESSLSALLSGMAASPPLHRQTSLDKADKGVKHRSSYERFPPVPLEISFMFSSSDGSDASFDPSTLCMGESDLANACDQVQVETLDWDHDDDAVLPVQRADDTSWQHHYEMPDTFHNSTTTHDSTWGMTTTTLEEDALVEKQRAATWSGGNCWEEASPTNRATSTSDRSRRVHFA